MKTLTKEYKVYSFLELSAEAKEKVYTVVKAIYDDNKNVIDCEVIAVCRSEKKARSYIKGFGYGIKESRLV